MKPIGYTKEGIKIYGPQKGPQTAMLSSSADIVIGGGAAGGGKTVWLEFEGAKGVHFKDFTGIIFRRQYNDIISPGGVWDTSIPIYESLNGYGVRGNCEWTFPSNAKIKFSHLNTENDKYNHQGPAYTYIGFDELTQFSKTQFFYLLSRNRNFGSCKMRPYCRGSCNPDADSWVADLISWWWDKETGYPIPERQGVIRYFIRDDDNDDIEWVSKDYRDKNGDPPKSITFIASYLEDNKLMPNISQYRSSVMAMDKVNRERLSKGNWLISFSGGMFNPAWFEIIDKEPEGIKWARYWDTAATEVDEEKMNDPDWTSGAKCGIKDGVYYISDIVTYRETPAKSEVKMKEVAFIDSRDTEIWWEEEKAAAGKFTSQYLSQVFSGYSARPDPVKGKKEERAAKWAAWAEFGRVKIVKGEWNKKFLAQAGKFPLGKRDIIDSISGAFGVLVGPKPILEYYVPSVHVDSFKRDIAEFNKIDHRNVSVYIVLWLEENGGIYGGCFLWSHKARKLKMYNEIYSPYPVTSQLIKEIKIKAIVPIEYQDHFITVKKILCNDMMAKTGKSNIKKDLANSGIRITEGKLFDLHSSIFRVNRMLAEQSLIIHGECVETDVQMRRWAYSDKKIPVNGFPLAMCVCMVESHIRDQISEVRPDAILTPYSKTKTKIRESLRITHDGKKENNQYLYLT